MLAQYKIHLWSFCGVCNRTAVQEHLRHFHWCLRRVMCAAIHWHCSQVTCSQHHQGYIQYVNSIYANRACNTLIKPKFWCRSLKQADPKTVQIAKALPPQCRGCIVPRSQLVVHAASRYSRRSMATYTKSSFAVSWTWTLICSVGIEHRWGWLEGERRGGGGAYLQCNTLQIIVQSASSRSAVSAAASANYASGAAYQLLQVVCSWWLFTAIVIEIIVGLEYSRKSFQLHDNSSVLQLIDRGWSLLIQECHVWIMSCDIIHCGRTNMAHHTCLAAEMLLPCK